MGCTKIAVSYGVVAEITNAPLWTRYKREEEFELRLQRNAQKPR